MTKVQLTNFFSKKKHYDDGMKRNGAKLPMFFFVDVFIRTHKRRISSRLSEFAIYTEELFKKPKRNKKL